MTSIEPVRAAAWFRVSTGHQSDANQFPDVDAFAMHHGYDIGPRYQVSDSAWKDGGGDEYKAELDKAMSDAWAGKFSVLIVWSLDRIVRKGAEDALRIFRLFRERGCTVLSVKESWLNGSPEVQDILISFAGWAAQIESDRRSARIKAGLARKRAEDPEFRPGRKPGATDKKKRKRSGYVAAWEEDGARRRVRQPTGTARTAPTANPTDGAATGQPQSPDAGTPQQRQQPPGGQPQPSPTPRTVQGLRCPRDRVQPDRT